MVTKKQNKLSPYRKIGKTGPYPKWVRDLENKSGVYVIRRVSWSGLIYLYVGESHSGKLRGTLTRHFQRWKGETAGPTFQRGSVEVSVLVTTQKNAVKEQDRLIKRFNPKHNKQGKEEEVPF